MNQKSPLNSGLSLICLIILSILSTSSAIPTIILNVECRVENYIINHLGNHESEITDSEF